MGCLGFVLEGQLCETENSTHSQDVQRALTVRKYGKQPLKPVAQFCTAKQGGKNVLVGWVWRRMPLTPANPRQRRVDLCDLKARLVYRVHSGTTRAM